MVGGTGLYFQSLINGLVKIPHTPIRLRTKIRLIQKNDGQKKFYKKLLKLDSKVRNKFNPNDVQRSIRAFEVKLHTKTSIYDWVTKTKSKFRDNDFLKLYLNFDRQNLIKRISLRTFKIIKKDAIDEVKGFGKLKLNKERTANKIIGIQELGKYLNNEIKLDEAKELISIRTRQYAKRQATWARSKMISWNKIDPNEIMSWIKKINKSSLKLYQLI